MDIKSLFSRMRSPEPKIFVIGFNKCGTKTLHSFFMENGIRSLHNRLPAGKNGERVPAALIIETNLASGRRVLEGLREYQAFSDLILLKNDHVIEANGYFREFHRDHPNAYFIFNDRPVEDWIASRLAHEGGPGGSFLKRYQSVMKTSRAEVIDYWRQSYEAHKTAVLDYFGNNERFVHFDITRDGPEKLIDALSADFNLDPEHWKHKGSREDRLAKHVRKQKHR